MATTYLFIFKKSLQQNGDQFAASHLRDVIIEQMV